MSRKLEIYMCTRCLCTWLPERSQLIYSTCPCGALVECSWITQNAEIIGKRLTDAGFDRASTLLGQYLILKRNRDKFDKWFKEVCDASTRETDSCFDSLDQWCLRFLY
ncbi:unnamed protein product [Hermetia illucens]|uniref:Uncharacterized protein n=1 Tax=Hermetia illucens TaxID=343691 RepID=A0A7R8UDG9_HERIL|nr:unnamed protein product [Hermetia illucens]